MSDPIINRIYELKISGYDDAITKVEALTSAFLRMDDTKRKLNSQLQEKISAGDTEAVNQLISKIKDLEAEMEKLKAKRDSAAKEEALLAKAEKDRSDALLKTQKATESLAKTEQIRANTAISQEKELDRQIALDEKKEKQLLKEKEAADSLDGSYNRLRETRKQLEAFTAKGDQSANFNLNGNLIGYDEALAKIKEIKLAEQQYLDQQKIEKQSQASIIKDLQEKVTLTKIQRMELEKVVSQSGPGQQVSVKGNVIDYKDAIVQIEQLKQAEIGLTNNLEAQGVQTNLLKNNYYGLLAAQQEAINLYRKTELNSPIFEDVKRGAVEAAEKVQAFNRTLSPDGTLVGEYKTGILNAFKNLGLTDILKQERANLQAEFNKLQQQNERLAAAFKQSGTTGTNSFREFESQLKKNVVEQDRIRESLVNLDASLKNTGSIGSNISEGIANGFKNLKNQIGQVLVTYVGFQAVFSGLSSGVQITKDLADQQSNLEVELGKSAGGADNLVTQLSKLNTRTKLTVLEDIANIAAKAGVGEDRIVGVTQAIDKIKVAFGKDFGDVEEGTESLVKLINIFEGADQVTGENLLKTGNAVRTLANESVASVPFINDFSKRMAGLKGITDISLPSVLGLASGFEQFGQTAEVSSTALVRIIPKLGENAEKYANIAGVTKQAFSDLLNSDPTEALLKVSEGLVKGKGSLEEFSTEFKNSALGSGRISSVIGVLGSKSDEFRKSIQSAAAAYEDTGNITDAFAAKNENLASKVDKISKAFSDAANTTVFKGAVSAVSAIILVLIGNLPLLLTFLGLLAISWGVQNAQLVLLNAQVLGYNLLIGATAILQGTLTVANGIYLAGLFLLNGAYFLVTRAAALFNVTMGRTPIGLILTGLALLLSAYEAFGGVLNSTRSALDRTSDSQRALLNVQKESLLIYSKQIAEIDSWVAVLKSAKTSVDTKAHAVSELTKINKAFGGVMKDNVVDLDLLKAAYDNVTGSIIKQATAAASANLAAQKQQKLVVISQARQIIEQTLAQRKDFVAVTGENDVPKEVLDVIKKLPGVIVDRNIDFSETVAVTKKNSDTVLNSLKKVEDTALADFTTYNSLSEKAQSDLKVKLENIAPVKIKPVEIDINQLKEDLKAYDEQIQNFRGTQKELNSIIAGRKKVQDELDAAMGKETKTRTRGSQLSGAQKDLFKDIDAKRDQEITTQKLLFKELEIGEETYIKSVLQINITAADKKISLLKGTNAEERKQIAEQKLFKIEQEEESNKKLFDLEKKRLTANFEEIKNQSQSSQSKQIDDPTKTEQEKRKIKADYLVQDYIIQLTYNEQLDKLEKKYNQRSFENATERKNTLLNIEDELSKIDMQITVGVLDEIDDKTDKATAAIKLKYDKLKEQILNSSAPDSKKTIAITTLNRTEDIEVGGSDLAGLNEKIAVAGKLYAQGKITLEEYEAIYSKLVAAQQKLNASIEEGKDNISDFKTLLSSAFDKLFGFQKGSGKETVLAQTLSEAFSTASNAMNDYFDSEKNRIQESLRINEQRLDIELNQQKSKAQSQAEMDSLDRQFAVKKEAEEKKAFEKNKKLQIEQAKINLAIQLSNLAVVAFAPNPLNIATLGLAGIIMYSAQAALAVANYALNVSRIRSAQFAAAKGGKVPHLSSGKITHESNIPEQKNGDNILATVKTNEVILNEEQQRKAGGASFFKKLGVPGFADGGKVSDLRSFATGGYTGSGSAPLGSNLEAPINPQGFLKGSDSGKTEENSRQIEVLTFLIKETGRQINQRIDKFQVILNPEQVRKLNDKTRKATVIGNI